MGFYTKNIIIRLSSHFYKVYHEPFFLHYVALLSNTHLGQRVRQGSFSLIKQDIEISCVAGAVQG
jgi:hypothetical protein